MSTRRFLEIAVDLEDAGLIWRPEVGDEISDRKNQDFISVLVDPQGMSPSQLRSTYLWLPTVEQIMSQLEARQAFLFHSGFEMAESDIGYKSVVKTSIGAIEAKAVSLRESLGLVLRSLLIETRPGGIQ